MSEPTSDNLKISQLIVQIASNDMDALAELYALTEKRVFVYALSYAKNGEDASDIKQDVFIRVKSYAHMFDGRNGLGWLYAITRNASLNFIKRRKRENVSIDDIGEDFRTTTISATRTDLTDALKLLGKKERQVVLYHLYLGYKHDETSKQLGLPLTTVKFYYLRALKKLKELLKDNDRF